MELPVINTNIEKKDEFKTKNFYLVRPQPAGHPDLILKIDWKGIKERGETLTNYQLFPGDRIVVPGGKDPGLLGTLLGGG